MLNLTYIKTSRINRIVKPNIENYDNLEIAHRVARDIIKRGVLGPYIYPVFWPLIAIATDFHLSHSDIFKISELLLILVSILRLLHSWSLKHFYPQHFSLWNKLLLLTAMPQGIIWGLLFAFSLTIENNTFTVFMAFSTAGYVAGGTNSFAPNRLMSYSFILTFILPPIIVTTLYQTQWVFASMLVVYLIYMISLSKNQQREYWHSLNNELILAKQSRTDVLTQLDNRRYFDEKLNEFCHLSSRNHDQISIMMIDCDFFKKINDTYGHDFGDECLKHLANILSESLTRTTDVCARYGGEEFSVILLGVKNDGARIVAERMRKMVETTSIYHNDQEITMTVSIGVVSRLLERFTPELPTELFKQADSALYKAKQSGRNCCVYMTYDNDSESYIVVDTSDHQGRTVVT